MNKYRVVREFPDNPEPLNLLNIKTGEIIWAADDEFAENETVRENEIFIKEHRYVDDQGVHTGLFAFKKEVSIRHV